MTLHDIGTELEMYKTLAQVLATNIDSNRREYCINLFNMGDIMEKIKHLEKQRATLRSRE